MKRDYIVEEFLCERMLVYFCNAFFVYDILSVSVKTVQRVEMFNINKKAKTIFYHLNIMGMNKELQYEKLLDTHELKGTVHQMYECVSEVSLYLGRMSGIVFTAQTAQIWPKNEKTWDPWYIL